MKFRSLFLVSSIFFLASCSNFAPETNTDNSLSDSQIAKAIEEENSALRNSSYFAITNSELDHKLDTNIFKETSTGVKSLDDLIIIDYKGDSNSKENTQVGDIYLTINANYSDFSNEKDSISTTLTMLFLALDEKFNYNKLSQALDTQETVLHYSNNLQIAITNNSSTSENVQLILESK